MLIMKLNLGDTVQANSCGANCPTMTVSSLITPSIGGTYNIRYLIYGDGSSTA